MIATQIPEFIIVGRRDAASYTLWDIAPAPFDLSRRQRVVEELDVEAADAFGQVDIIQGATAAQALDAFLDGLRWASGNPDYALAPSSDTSNLAAASACADGAAKAGMVLVEAAVWPGQDSFRITGWHHYDSTPDARIQGAIVSSGFTFPSGGVSVRIDNHRGVAGTLDLAAACTILAASGQLDPRVLGRVVLLGELRGFDGAVNSLPGITDAATTAHVNGHRVVLVPARQAHDVRALGLGLNVIGVRDLAEAVAALRALADQT
ncbi:magnesium chelatase domain-containing protein [Streptomyces olivochromogenes]|uniref:magnesium chelatase domain-containing protein n=1 Tax=Streptomyces olivochromogenes TaxID=1963 RepID=UPI0036A8366B